MIEYKIISNNNKSIINFFYTYYIYYNNIMFQFLDFNSPIKNSIILFIILVIILLSTKPKLLKEILKIIIINVIFLF